ncbi:hypothetical protein [Microbacterium sp. NPDC087591]|jgi:hypothetical protein
MSINAETAREAVVLDHPRDFIKSALVWAPFTAMWLTSVVA